MNCIHYKSWRWAIHDSSKHYYYGKIQCSLEVHVDLSILIGFLGKDFGLQTIP